MGKFRDPSNKSHSLITTNEGLQNKISFLQEDLKDSQEKKERLQKELEELRVGIEEIQEQHRTKENTFKTKLNNEIQQFAVKASKTTHQYKNKHLAYRSKLEKCKKRIRQLMEKNSGLEMEMRAQQEIYDSQIESTRRKIRELEREKQILFRKGSDSVIGIPLGINPPGTPRSYQQLEPNDLQQPRSPITRMIFTEQQQQQTKIEEINASMSNLERDE